MNGYSSIGALLKEVMKCRNRSIKDTADYLNIKYSGWTELSGKAKIKNSLNIQNKQRRIGLPCKELNYGALLIELTTQIIVVANDVTKWLVAQLACRYFRHFALKFLANTTVCARNFSTSDKKFATQSAQSNYAVWS